MVYHISQAWLVTEWGGGLFHEPSQGPWILPDLVGRVAALEFTMTGRRVGAAEGLALGLVNRIDEDPDRVAVGLAETLASLGPQAAGKIKTITSAGRLLDRLRAERRANQAAWERMIAEEPG